MRRFASLVLSAALCSAPAIVLLGCSCDPGAPQRGEYLAPASQNSCGSSQATGVGRYAVRGRVTAGTHAARIASLPPAVAGCGLEFVGDVMTAGKKAFVCLGDHIGEIFDPSAPIFFVDAPQGAPYASQGCYTEQAAPCSTTQTIMVPETYWVTETRQAPRTRMVPRTVTTPIAPQSSPCQPAPQAKPSGCSEPPLSCTGPGCEIPPPTPEPLASK